MQTKRKTDIRFTLFFLVFILVGRSYDNNATLNPDVADFSAGPLNVVLRFASTTFWWLILSLAQYLWKFLIYERYISEPPEQLFVDFCTIAKVSVLVLDEPYHGYYLHCRSPHQYADGSMAELVEMLHKEEAGLTVDRSLEGAPADVQSFEIFVTGEWRAAFDKMYKTLIKAPTFAEILQKARTPRGALRAEALRAAAAGAGSGATGPGGGAGSVPTGRRSGNSGRAPTEKLLKAWKELAVFLQQFIENNFGKSNLRRVVRDPTYFEKFLGIPPDVSTMEQPSVFFTDRQFDYCRVLFRGRERDLLLLNILSYSLFDVWFGSTAISALLCYLLDYAVCFARDTLGRVSILLVKASNFILFYFILNFCSNITMACDIMAVSHAAKLCDHPCFVFCKYRY
jgi:meckelin